MEHIVLYLDVETNGIGTFRPATQRIMQISWIYNENEYDYYVNDVEEISDKLPHDLTPEYCKTNGVDFDTPIDLLYRHLQHCDKIVGHNVLFDIGCILHELKIRKHRLYRAIKRLFIDFSDSNDIFCTMENTVDVCKIPLSATKYKFPKLGELYHHMFMTSPESLGTLHDSITDCRVTKACYEKLKNL